VKASTPPPVLRALGFFALVALVVGLPGSLMPERAVLGDPLSDMCTHLWGMWWTGQDASGLLPWMFERADSINHPHGGALISCTPLNDALAQPIAALLGIEAAYNIVMLGNLALAATGAFLLARWLTRDTRASLIAGLAFGFTPYALSYGLASGGTEMVAIGWLPLATLALLRTIDAPSWRWPLIGGACTAAMGASCVYYGPVFGLLGLAIAGRWLLRLIRDAELRATAPRTAARMLLFAVVTMILAAPHLSRLHTAVTSPDAVLEPARVGDLTSRVFPVEGADGDYQHILDGASASAIGNIFLANVITPGPGGVQLSEEVTRFYLAPYIGLSVLALALLGLWNPGRRRLAFWWAVFGVFLLIAMGPRLAITESLHLQDGLSPAFLALYHLYPLHPLNHDACYYAVSLMAASVAVAHGVVVLQSKLPAAWRQLGLAAVGALVLADLVLLSGLGWPLPAGPIDPPQAWAALAERDGGAVVELPVFHQASRVFERPHFCWQPTHGRPIADTLIGFPARSFEDNPLLNSLVGLEMPRAPLRRSYTELARGAALLRDQGFTDVLVEPAAYDPVAWTTVRATLDLSLGAPTEYVDGSLRYALEHSEPTLGAEADRP